MKREHAPQIPSRQSWSKETGPLLFDAGNLVGLEMTLFLGVLLTPYLKIEIHTRLVFIISGFNLNEFVFERLLVILRLCILALVFPS